MAGIQHIRIVRRFELNLGDRGIVEIGGEFETDVDPETDPNDALSALTKRARESTSDQARALLTELQMDESIAHGTIELLRVIANDR
jgi:hypothetical protein